MNQLETIRAKKGFICDMDGVIYHGRNLLPGAKEFVNWLQQEKKQYLFLTNNSQITREELSRRLQRMGLEVDPLHFYTAALSTASFLYSQQPGASVYVIGDAGLSNALYGAGFVMNDLDPDFVVLGETRSYSYEKVEKAINLVRAGARLIATNPDLAGPHEGGLFPGCGALAAPIELASGRKAYFLGKPNPLMIRHALLCLECPREEAVFIGDQMDTDIIAGVNSDIDTILVLSGITAREDLARFAYRPKYVLGGVGEIAPGA
ncbi:HAD family hydrolase [Desulfocarbo indianensis]|nr:HAD family hydrolase [Desulfocarbo indianensis]